MNCILFVLFAVLQAVPDLKGEEFNQFISQNPSAHIIFAAPWCGHCKQFKPIFYKVAKMASGIKFGEVDCTVENDICQKYGVRGYPTIKYFKNGEAFQDYQGERTVEAFHDYVVDLSKPLMTMVEHVKEFEIISADNSSVKLFGFFCKDDELFKAFKAASDSMFRKIMDFYYTHSTEVCQAGQQESAVVMYGPTQFVYSAGGDQSLPAWLKDSYLGPCGLRSSQTEGLFVKPTLMAYFSVDYANNRKYSEYYRKRMVKVMEQNSYSFMCGYADIDVHAEPLNLGNAQRIAVFMFAEDGKKYKMEDAFSIQSVTKFADDYLAGNLKPSIKSAPIPESNPSPGLHELVGLNFDQVVNQDKNVFILFYAPWCGHCKNVLPVYEQLAKEFEGDASVVIARMDATSNDVPSNYQVTGFPTFYYSPRNNKEAPVKYPGNRDLNSFIDFLRSMDADSSLDPSEL